MQIGHIIAIERRRPVEAGFFQEMIEPVGPYPDGKPESGWRPVACLFQRLTRPFQKRESVCARQRVIAFEPPAMTFQLMAGSGDSAKEWPMGLGDQAWNKPAGADTRVIERPAQPLDTAAGTIKPHGMALGALRQIGRPGNGIPAVIENHRDDGGGAFARRPYDPEVRRRVAQDASSFSAIHQWAISAPCAIHTLGCSFMS